MGKELKQKPKEEDYDLFQDLTPEEVAEQED